MQDPNLDDRSEEQKIQDACMYVYAEIKYRLKSEVDTDAIESLIRKYGHNRDMEIVSFFESTRVLPTTLS